MNATNEAALAIMPITPAARSTKSRPKRSAAQPATGAANTCDSAITASAKPTSRFEFCEVRYRYALDAQVVHKSVAA